MKSVCTVWQINNICVNLACFDFKFPYNLVYRTRIMLLLHTSVFLVCSAMFELQLVVLLFFAIHIMSMIVTDSSVIFLYDEAEHYISCHFLRGLSG